MARTSIDPVALTKTGYNLTDSTDFTTMSTGAGNGVEFTLDVNDIVVFKNDTGGAAVFTIDTPQETRYSEKGIAVPDGTVSVANGKTYLYPLSSIFKQSNSKVYIDCDVAGKILILSP